MNIATALHIALAAVVMGLAAWTVIARETFAATVGFLAYDPGSDPVPRPPRAFF